MKRGAFILAVIFFIGCVGEKKVEEVMPDVFVATTDYQTGSYSLLKMEDGNAWVSNSPIPVHSDSVARYHDGYIYLIQRYGSDSIMVIDIKNRNFFSPVTEFSVGAGTNPQDIAFAGNKAYVSRLQAKSLLVIDPLTGNKIKEIDLSRFADEDGIPEMAGMAVYNKRLFVALQILDENQFFWPPVDNGKLIEIDTDKDEILKEYKLNGKNPWSSSDSLLQFNDFIYLIEHGSSFDTTDGIVEKFNPSDGSLEKVTTEKDLGGDISDIAIFSEDKAFAVISDEKWNTKVVEFNLRTGKKTKEIFSPEGYSISDIEVDENLLLISYRPSKGKSGIIVVNADTGEVLTEEPIETSLPPFDIEVIK